MAVVSSQLPPMSPHNHEGLHPFFDISSRIRRSTDTSTEHSNEHQANKPDPTGSIESNGAQIEQKDESLSASPSSNIPSKPTDRDLPSSSPSRKRRKTTPSHEEEDSGWLDQLKSAANTDQSLYNDTTKNTDSPSISNPKSSTQSEPDISLDDKLNNTEIGVREYEHSQQKPAKVLRLNGKGGFGSPQRGRRSRKSKDEGTLGATQARGKKLKSLMVTLSYSVSDNANPDSLCRKIERILIGEERFMQPPMQQPAVQLAAAPSVSKGLNTSKTTHPFFLGKVLPKVGSSNAQTESPQEQEKPSDSLKTFSTPGKLRQQRSLMLNAGKEAVPTKPDGPLFGSTTRKRVHGTNEALWPPKGMVHSGPDGPCYKTGASSVPPPGVILDIPLRKYKTRVVALPEEEDVVSRFSKRVLSLPIRDNNQSGIRLETLRLPIRSISSGPGLQHSVRGSLKSMAAFGNREANTDGPPGQQQLHSTHPAIEQLFASLANGLSAFDKGECEPTEWAHKYAPKCAEHILQPGKEAIALKAWLHSLTVDSVAGAQVAGVANTLADVKLEKLKRRRKKRRKVDELDDFIVNSDDEDSEMHELSDDADELCSGIDLRRSVIRSSGGLEAEKALVKAANVVLLSGPHGCGKTASVYAVANELGFEVFEINSSSRRSGRDVIDRVGDLAMNHQVRRKKEYRDQHIVPTDEALGENPVEQPRVTMKSFFQSKPLLKPTKSSSKSKDGKLGSTNDKRKERRQQQQALILLEEVDVIFEEDRQFWETVLDLAIQSRRPIVMTCNDETSVPLTGLSIHAIFRFRSAPADVAIDYLLLVAAAEGHLLDYAAVSALYRAKGNDLRSSLVELNFWCQMGVGDCKGGLEWYLKRWPIGCDVDQNGHTSRVVSNSTYQAGMGWFGRDQCLNSDMAQSDTAEKFLQAWKEWGLEPLEASFSNRLKDTSENSSEPTMDPYSALKAYEHDSDMLSAIDVVCKVDLPSTDMRNDILDPTQPPLSEQPRHDFPCCATLLDAPMQIDFQQLDTEISVAVVASLQQGARRAENPSMQKETCEFTEDTFKRAVLNRTSELPSIASKIERALDDVVFESSLSLSTTCHLAEDIAPYVRSIVSFDIALEKHRSVLHGEPATGKRIRNTRSSRSAMEGSLRATTRRERWFPKINSDLILSTAGKDWHHGGYASDSSF